VEENRRKIIPNHSIFMKFVNNQDNQKGDALGVLFTLLRKIHG
jgi:hypothetical protein